MMGASPSPGPIFVIGTGKVGTSLGLSLSHAGFPVFWVSRQSPREPSLLPCIQASSFRIPPDQPVVVLLAVPDRLIEETGRDLVGRSPGNLHAVMGHLSGVIPSSVLPSASREGTPIGRFSAHPLFAFPPPATRQPVPAGVPFLFEGDGEGPLVAQVLISAIDGRPVPIAPEDKPLAHAAAVLSANLPAELVWTAADLFRSIGVPEPESVAAGLFQSLAENLSGSPALARLTGPVARGDPATVRANLEALNSRASQGREIPTLYRRLSRRLVARLETAGLLDIDLARALREAMKQ